MWPESSRTHFIDVRCSSCTTYKNVLGFFNGRFENCHQNLRIFYDVPANLHIAVTKHLWKLVNSRCKLKIGFNFWPWPLFLHFARFFCAFALKLSSYRYIKIQFPYNARSDWHRQRTLPENRARVDDIKLAYKFLLRNFDSAKSNVNGLFVSSKYGSRRPLLTTVV